jgi:hypothetical protein
MQITNLVETANAMRELSYAPYRFAVTPYTPHVTRHTSHVHSYRISKFHVGAAVLCDDGTIVTGCNVEQVMCDVTCVSHH